MPIVKNKTSGHRMNKADAHYTPIAVNKKERCVNCTMFREPGYCTLVIGGIEPGGSCKYFETK